MVSALLVAGCAKTPTLPESTPRAVSAQLSGPDARQFLTDISTHDWPDAGAEPGQRFGWIPADATSADVATATRAGESAHVLATLLADGPGVLADSALTSHNTALLTSYAAALTPYQAAMLSAQTPMPGFEPLDPPGGDRVNTRTVFVLFDHNTEVGTQFSRAAQQRAQDMVAVSARSVLQGTSGSTSQPNTRHRRPRHQPLNTHWTHPPWKIPIPWPRSLHSARTPSRALSSSRS